MHALSTKLSKSNNPLLLTKEKRTTSRLSDTPIMTSSLRSRDSCIAPWRQRASYYYDASLQTGKTFRQLVNSVGTSHDTSCLALGTSSNSQLLVEQTHFFLNSLRPFVNGTMESKAKYANLLQMHLSAIARPTLDTLASHLQQLGYECQITESVIDDAMYLDYGFCNGPPHTKKNILLNTSEFFALLDSQHRSSEYQELAVSELQEISTTHAQAIRHQLSVCASDWSDSDKSPQSLLNIARHLEYTVTGNASINKVSIFEEEPGPSKALQKGEKLLVDLATIHGLSHQNNESLFAVLLRDILEIFLAKKIFGPTTNILHLSVTQQRRVWSAIETIQAIAPKPRLLSAFRTHIKTLLMSRESFGKVHIIPASGVALGHAWIAPSLSITPDHQKLGIPAGTCYLHSGARLHATIAAINEWPIQWLTSSESEHLYPTRRAWHLSVPVPAKVLELAAKQLREEWKLNNQAYRFVAVSPDTPAASCRTSVWAAVEKGLDANTKLLFTHFNCGLPLPDSTIELWERLNGFMQWLVLIASGEDTQAL